MTTEDKVADPVTEALKGLDPSFTLLAQGAVDAGKGLLEIQSKLKANAGTQAEVLRNATNVILGHDVSIPEDNGLDKVGTYADLAIWLVEAQDWADQMVKDARDSFLKAKGQDKDNSAALKEQFAQHKAVVEAFKVMAAMPGMPVGLASIADALVVPDLRGSTTAGSSKVKVGNVIWGITKKGVKSDIGRSQNKFSSTRFYYSKYFTADGEDMTLDEWRAFIRKQNPDWKGDADPFSVTNGDDSVQVWCEHRMVDDS